MSYRIASIDRITRLAISSENCASGVIQSAKDADQLGALGFHGMTGLKVSSGLRSGGETPHNINPSPSNVL